MTRLGIVVIAFMLALMPLAAGAEVPPETLEKIALLRVEAAKLRHLEAMGQLTPQEHARRAKGLKSQEAALWQPYRRLPQDEQTRAANALNGLITAQLAILTPQWTKEQRARQDAQAAAQRKTLDSLEVDVRKALEFQRERLSLQKQLSAGTLTQDAFSQKDRAALAAIADIRKAYEAAGTTYANRFDHHLNLMTKALADDPSTFIPQRQVMPLAPGQTPDFQADVQLARSLWAKRKEISEKFHKKLISSDTYRESDVIYGADIQRLELRYEAISRARGDAFRAASQARSAPPPPPSSPTSTTVRTQPQTDHTGTLTVLAILIGVPGLIIAWIVYLIFRKKPPPPQEPPVSDIYGTAAWAEVRESPEKANAVAQGVSFGKSSAPGRSAAAPGAPVTSFPEAHALVIGRTRAGKGTRVVVPTLLRYGASMLVVDPKGENAAITARTRRDQLGQAVHIVNPWGEMEGVFKSLGFTSATFNPLEVIERNDPNAVSIAESLAAIICPRETGDSKFWSGSATAVLSGVFLWLADRPGEQKTLGRARELLATTRKDFADTLTRMAASTAFSGAIKEKVSQLIGMDDKTYSGIMATVNENMNFMSDPRMKASTAESSLSMQALRRAPTTIYLIASEERMKTHGTWLRLVIASAMEAMKKASQTGLGTHRCMFLIDEFGALGRIESLPRDIATMSGRGVDFTLVLQGIDQLKDHYGEARATILNNCAYKWFCAVSDLETAKYVSETLGKATVRTVGTSESFSTNAGGGSANKSTSYGETGRPLLMPDEIMNLGRNIAIVLDPRTNPHYVRPVDYWQLAQTYAHLKDNYPDFYWQPPLTFDQNPYVRKPPHGDAPTMMSQEQARKILGIKEGEEDKALERFFGRQ